MPGLAQEPPGLQLGDRAFSGSAELGVEAVRLFLGGALVLALVGRDDDGRFGPLASLVREGEDPGLLQLSQGPPHAGCGQVWVLPGIAPKVHRIVPLGPAMVWTFIPWTRCLPEK